MNKERPALAPDDLTEMASLKHWGDPPESARDGHLVRDTIVDCGWGRLLFGQTFADADSMCAILQSEQSGKRDVALYVREPQVLLSRAPHALFLDPSRTYRLNLIDEVDPTWGANVKGLIVRPARAADQDDINRIYLARNMVPLADDFIGMYAQPNSVCLFVAEDGKSGDLAGVVMGVDHRVAFGDPDNGSSLWALAVDSQTNHAGVGTRLLKALATWFKISGRQFMDLSVMHDNTEAIALYEHLGFAEIPAYCVKKKNPVNEQLYIGPSEEAELNPYAKIIVDEARRRGISVEIEDADAGIFSLSLGGRTISCRESLSDLTSAVAMSRCDDKALTHRLLERVDVKVPAQAVITRRADALEFLACYKRVVVKPARGEQGQGVMVDLKEADSVVAAFRQVREICDSVLIEEFVTGQDLRVIVIGGEAVAAAVRKPAAIIGDGIHTIIELIDKRSRRRAAATGGESAIPLDNETERCVRQSGHNMLDILPADAELTVRKTANLHTGGTIHDVTGKLHPRLAKAACRVAEVLNMPVVGVDLIVTSPEGPDYRVIEANERPGLANHEPAPTAEKFVDLLFPDTRAKSAAN